MAKKLKRARAMLKDALAYGIKAPSPADVIAAQTPAGGWTAATLAGWGIAWPPRKGWREDLERRWKAEQFGGDGATADRAVAASRREAYRSAPAITGRGNRIEVSDQLPWES